MPLELLKNSRRQNDIKTPPYCTTYLTYCHSCQKPIEDALLYRHLCNNCGINIPDLKRRKMWAEARQLYPELLR